jgi:anaerobic magnesium-protoporphyrin IX monomethyl ester cyclase
MRVLFISPPADNMLASEVPEVISTERGFNPPLGLLYLASRAKAAGHEVEVIDSQVEELSQGQIRERIGRANPDVVAVTATSFTLIDAVETIRSAKDAAPSAPVLFGGPHATIYPGESADLPGVDYAFSGEGEESLVRFLDALRADGGNGRFRDIPGIAFKNGRDTFFQGQAPFITDLDRLPFPDRSMIPYKRYTSLLAKRNPITTLFSSRGCPYKCMFCDRPQMGKVFRARSAKNVVDEIEECAGLGIREILIYDDTFTVDRARVLDICRLIGERGLDVGFDIRARVNTVDAEVLSALRRAGCERIHYGVESGNQDILNFIRKGIGLKQVEEAFRLTKEAGIETLAYFMLGHPRETRQTVQETIDFAVKLDPTFVHFTIATPFPATDLYRLGLAEGRIKEDVWKRFAENPTADFKAPKWEENLTQAELQDLLKRAYKRFYLRPRYVLTRMARIRSLPELKRKVKAGLRVAGM